MVTGELGPQENSVRGDLGPLENSVHTKSVRSVSVQFNCARIGLGLTLVSKQTIRLQNIHVKTILNFSYIKQ